MAHWQYLIAISGNFTSRAFVSAKQLNKFTTYHDNVQVLYITYLVFPLAGLKQLGNAYKTSPGSKKNDFGQILRVGDILCTSNLFCDD